MSTPHHKYALIIAGGSGSRLWPMSRKSLPKQFQYLLGKQTPFQLMVELTSQVIPLDHIMIMAVPQFKQLILEQVPGLPEENILIEPSARDTGPAIILGMLQLQMRDPEATAITLWSDHLVLDHEKFAQVLEAALAASAEQPSRLVAVGAKPTKADPSLGYIHMGASVGTFNDVTVHTVQRFVEKPDQATADDFFASQEYLWNVGYNVMATASFFEQLRVVSPELQEPLEKLQKALQGGTENIDQIATAYDEFPKTSIDYLFTQKLKDMAVVPADMGWSDIGTWTTLHTMMVSKSGKNLITQGEVQSINSQNTLVFAKDRPIVLVGVEDLIVVDTGDTVLVMHHNAPASDLKKIVQETLSESNPELL